MNDDYYYKPSGIAPTGGLIISFFGGIILTALLSIIYIASQWYIPVLVINFYIPILVSILLFGCLNFLFRYGKIRNPTVFYIYEILFSFLLFYAQWALFASLMYRSEGKVASIWLKSSFHISDMASFLVHPTWIFQLMQGLNEYGTFQLKGNTVTGILLWMVWAGEFAIMTIFPIIALASNRVVILPFSEKENEWMHQIKLPEFHPFITDVSAIEQDFTSLSFNYLKQKSNSLDMLEPYATITIFEYPGDPYQYILIKNHIPKKGKNNQVIPKVKDMVKYLKLPAGTIS